MEPSKQGFSDKTCHQVGMYFSSEEMKHQPRPKICVDRFVKNHLLN